MKIVLDQQPRINCLVFRECLRALFLNPDYFSSRHDSWLKSQQTKKQYNIRATLFKEIVYLKQRQVDIMSLVLKRLNLCPVMPASWGVNPLVTSHTVEHLSSICLHNRSHDKPIVYFISHCMNKIYIVWNPWKKKKKNVFLQYWK